ncbi:MAG: PHP-associated domain-containing protein [Candidatus Woesearchaeota archaeon]
MLKSDFHTHAGTDEHHKLDHTPRELILQAAKLGYDVLAITNHNKITYDNSLKAFAKKRGILLMPGVEAVIDKKEVILLNISKSLLKKVRTFEDLERYKSENMLVMAPHPFYPDSRALQKKLEQNINLFDAIEYSHFYLSWYNKYNEMAQAVAKKYKKTMLGTSDCHTMEQFGTTHSLVDAEKSTDSVFEAVRKKKSRIVTEPLTFFRALRILSRVYMFY